MKIVSALSEKLSVLNYGEFYYTQSAKITWRILNPCSAHDSTSYVTVMEPKERRIIYLFLSKLKRLKLNVTTLGVLLLQYRYYNDNYLTSTL